MGDRKTHCGDGLGATDFSSVSMSTTVAVVRLPDLPSVLQTRQQPQTLFECPGDD